MSLPELPENANPPDVGESLLVRCFGWFVCCALGVLTGLLGTVLNQATIDFARLPIGLILALVTATLLLVGLCLIMPNRLPGIFAAVGLVATVFLFALPSAGGSVLIPANLYGYLWIFSPTVISLIVLAWPSRLKTREFRG